LYNFLYLFEKTMNFAILALAALNFAIEINKTSTF
jgi:hypothetical protein